MCRLFTLGAPRRQAFSSVAPDVVSPDPSMSAFGCKVHPNCNLRVRMVGPYIVGVYSVCIRDLVRWVESVYFQNELSIRPALMRRQLLLQLARQLLNVGGLAESLHLLGIRLRFHAGVLAKLLQHLQRCSQLLFGQHAHLKIEV
jgi:hypothetical protein